MAVRSGAARTPAQFAAMLRTGETALRDVVERDLPAGFVGAPLAPEDLGPAPRGASRALMLAVRVACEALAQAGIDDPACAVVVAGSNITQRASFAASQKYLQQPEYTPVRHGYEVFDTHLASAVAEAAGLHGAGLSVGGASASGNSALIVAADMVALGRVPACVVVGAPPDFSPVEWQALDAMGALLPAGSVCRPMDRRGAGFAPGMACAAVVIEPLETARVPVLAEIAGSGMTMDAARGTVPQPDGEAQAMRLALGGLPAVELGLISAHATGTPAGDAAECQAIAAVLGHAAVAINATKSLTGHAIQAAGLVGLVAVLVQMQGGFLHGTAGLEQPLTPDLHLLGPGTVERRIDWALNNAFGFGGINTSVLLRNGLAL
jgi:malonyl-ACP decarboxylase